MIAPFFDLNFEDIISFLLSFILSKETVIAIERARERIKAGNFVTESEAKKRLGF